MIGNVLFVWPSHVVAAAGENALGGVVLILLGLVVSGLLHHQGIRLAAERRAVQWVLRGVTGTGLALVCLVDLALVV